MRKAAHEGLNKGVAHRYQSIQYGEAVSLAAGFLSQPENWDAHLRRAGASGIMSVVYNTPPIKSEHDRSVKAVNDFVARLTRAAYPGAHFVEFLPWMLHIPRRYEADHIKGFKILIPLDRFAKWKREAEDSYVTDSEMFESLFNGVREQIVKYLLLC